MLARPADQSGPRSVTARAARAVRRAVLRRRRLLVAVLVALAVGAGLRAVAAPPPPTVEVLVAAADLPAGTVLEPDDLHPVSLPPDAVPTSTAPSPTGRTLAAPLRRGEPVTDVRLVGPDLTEGLDDVVAVPLRLPDAGSVGLLRVGDVVDLVGADPRGGGAHTVVDGARVLALPGTDPDDAGTGATGLPGRLLVVGVPTDEVDGLVAAAVDTVLSYVWRTR